MPPHTLSSKITPGCLPQLSQPPLATHATPNFHSLVQLQRWKPQASVSGPHHCWCRLTSPHTHTLTPSATAWEHSLCSCQVSALGLQAWENGDFWSCESSRQHPERRGTWAVIHKEVSHLFFSIIRVCSRQGADTEVTLVLDCTMLWWQSLSVKTDREKQVSNTISKQKVGETVCLWLLLATPLS